MSFLQRSLSMKRLLFLLSLIIFVSAYTPTAGAQDRRYAFLDPYLSDPYSPLEIADIGFNGPLFARLQRTAASGQTETFTTNLIYYDLVEVRDPGQHGRADLVIPVRAISSLGGGPQKFLLVFHNTPELIEVPTGTAGQTRRQHWDPVPEFIPAPGLPNSTNLTQRQRFIGDLNGDGLADRATLASTAHASLSFREGVIITFDDVLMNLGFDLVPEANVPSAVRDARLGYIASYAQTLFQGVAAPNPTPQPTPPTDVNLLPPGGPATPATPISLEEVTILRKAERRVFVPRDPSRIRAVEQIAQKQAAATQPTLAPSPQPSPTPNARLRTILAAHQELDFDVLRRGAGTGSAPQSYVPNLLIYRAGIQRGQDRARSLAGTFQSARAAFEAYVQSVEPLRQLTSSSSDQQVRDITADFTARLRTAETAGSLPTVLTTYSAAWVAVLNSPVFTPRRVDSNFVAVNLLTTGTPADAEVRDLMRQLDSEWVVPTRTDGQFVANSSRVVGMSLAFLNLMVMRSGDSYVSDMSNLQTAGDIIAQSITQASQLAAPLSTLATQANVLQAPGADFIMASVSSGYRDLPRYLASDHASILFIQGYKQGQEDALKIIKTALGGQIPGLSGASTLLEATTAISQFVQRQQLEIQRLNGLVNSLQQTINNLNRLLENANKLVEQLQGTNEELKRALEKAGGAFDAIGGLAKAGTGFLIGGPIGAGLCVLFC